MGRCTVPGSGGSAPGRRGSWHRCSAATLRSRRSGSPGRRIPGNKKPPGPEGSGGFGVAVETRLDRAADLRQDRADLRPEEDQGDDRDDRDEREDQRVLRETLALLVPTDRGEELLNECH